MEKYDYLIVGSGLFGATLDIYILQAILLEHVLPRYLSFAYLPMAAIIALVSLLSIAAPITATLSQSPLLAFLLLGRSYHTKDCL